VNPAVTKSRSKLSAARLHDGEADRSGVGDALIVEGRYAVRLLALI